MEPSQAPYPAGVLAELAEASNPVFRRHRDPLDVPAPPAARLGSPLAYGFACTVYALPDHPDLVVKQFNDAEKYMAQREFIRLARPPPLATLAEVFFQSGPLSLMPRYLPVHVPSLTSAHVLRLKEDVTSALSALHTTGIVHADVHLDNVMVNPGPVCYVPIDLGGTAGESLFPLALGFGAPGQGGDKHRPPHEEDLPPRRTVPGDFFRLARTIQKDILCHRCWRQADGTLTHAPKLPKHVRAELTQWVLAANVAQPTWPTSAFPGGSWRETANNPAVMVQAGLWDSQGRTCIDTAEFTETDQHFGNQDGRFVLETHPTDPGHSGSWEQSAAFARYYLKASLRTMGTHNRAIFVEISPFYQYSNQDGFLVREFAAPPPPPPERPDSPAASAAPASSPPVSSSLQGIWAAPVA